MSSGKVGRNEPCPCGSGKKFKKCCLLRDGDSHEAPGSTELEQFPSLAHFGIGTKSSAAVAADMSEEQPDGLFDLSLYAIAKIAEDPRSAGDNPVLRRAFEEGMRGRWTIKKVAGMKTEAIEEKLKAFGVRHSRERFLSLAEGRLSAWPISDTWMAEDGIPRTGEASGAEDFLGIAACELWKRLLDDRPSVEMLDDWMQDGYALAAKGKRAAACDVWWRVWTATRDRLFTPELTTMRAADAVLRATQSIFNWSQDFELELGNAALEDERYAIIGRQYCSEWAAQFTEEDGRMQCNFGHALARFHFLLGEPAVAERILHRLLDRWPNDPWCYIRLADAYAHVFRGEELPLDIDRSVALLKRALALADLTPDDRSTLADRLTVLAEKVDAPAIEARP